VLACDQSVIILLPKATYAEHQIQNLSVFGFELRSAEMAEIAALSRPDGRTANQDPNECEEF
jgi:diketogulonate reductase-like aldo/keto reductase